MMLEIVQEVPLRTALAEDRIKTKTSFERTKKKRLSSEIIYAKNVRLQVYTKGLRNAERPRTLLQKDYVMPKELENSVQKTLKAAKYEKQKPSTCCATFFRCKFSWMFPVFHLA